MSISNFIIGGTEKAGTTSVFMYLSDHPEVCGSLIKETNFFRQEFSGEARNDLAKYGSYFKHCDSTASIRMEASPGYLGEAKNVAHRIFQSLPQTKLLFILRDPVDRLYSSFNFHKSKLDIPQDLNIDNYITKCMVYEQGLGGAQELGLGEWFLKTLRYGKYSEMLSEYYSVFPKNQIKVMFFETLREDNKRFMLELSRFLCIDDRYWENYDFKRTNVTFFGKNRFLHRIALYINNKTEPFLRSRPHLKKEIVRYYKNINQSQEGYDSMPESVRKELEAYYEPYNRKLVRLVGKNKQVDWLDGK